MALPKVTISLKNGQLGTVDALGNGTPGLIVLMASAPTGHAFGEVKAYSSADDLPTELAALQALKNYFAVAEGRLVYIMPVVNTTGIDDVVDKDAATPYAKNLLEHDSDIRFIGVCGQLLVADLSTALTNAQALATALTANVSPALVILPYAYKNADTVVDLATGSNDRVGVCVSDAGHEVGLLIGRMASIPVQRNVGRVKDGAMPVTSAVLDSSTDPDTLIENGMATVEVLHGKGYIVLRTHTGRSGYYFADDPLATLPTGDFASIAHRRVIDKALIIAYGTYLNELLDEMEVDSAGKLPAGVVKYYQGIIENAINTQMTAAGEISAVAAFVDPDQNVLSSNKLTCQLAITPVGYAKAINVELGFDNPYNS